MGVRNGKWYYECKVVNKANGFMIGYMSASNLADVGDRATNNFPKLNGFQASGYIKRQDNTEVNISSSFTWANGDIAQIALDMDNKKLYFHKDGVYQNSGVPTSGSTGTGALSLTGNEYYLIVSGYKNSENPSIHANFGNGYFGTTAVSSAGTNASNNGIFEYDVPTGYTALSTKGLNL
jgi:hypothetical protein